MKDAGRTKGQAVTRKDREQDEHERVEYYTTIFQTVPSAVRVVDTDFNVIMANPAMAALSGQSIEASVDRKCFDTFRGERCHTKHCPLTTIRETKAPAKDEVVKERQDGAKLVCIALAAPLVDRKGMLTGIVEGFQDITELRQVSQYVRSLIEVSLDPMVTIGSDGKITDVNEATIKVTGVAREKLIGTDFESYFTEPAKAREGYQLVFSKGMVTDYPLTIRHKGGKLTDVLYNATVYKDVAGNILGVFAAARDVTERNKLEEELKKHRDHLQELAEERAKELREAQDELIRAERLATLGQFSGNISHELRNPLGVIDSSVYYLKTKLKDADEKVHEHLDRIKLSVSNSTAIIESLFNLTRMGEPRLTNLNLTATIDDAISTSKIPAKVKIIRNFPEGEVAVNGDREQLCMAFKNIIKNVHEAMDSRGTLTVTVSRTADGWVEVSFADTGSGIAVEDLEKIFQPLFSHKAQGIGFGLSITKMVVDKHGGKIEARSEPGKGANIIIQLPLYADIDREV